MIKRNKNYKDAFNVLNHELGENALPDEIRDAYKEQQDINVKIEDKIREISIVGVQLQEQKRNLETFLTDRSQKEHTMEPSISKEHIIEDQKKDTNFGQVQEEMMSFRDEDIFVGTEIESQVEERGSSLVLRKKRNDTKK